MTDQTKEKISPLVAAPAALAFLFLAAAVLGLLWRAPWSSIFTHLTSNTTTEALKTSLIVSISTALLSALFGMPLAYALSKITGRLQAFLRVVVLLPLVLPPVAGGTALLFALGRRGLIGQWLYDWFDISLPFTTAGAILAATFVALPFFVISTETALAQTRPELEDTARAFGAGRLAIFTKIIFPQILPGVLAGIALAWARAVGEFGATITFAGNLAGRTQTLPLAMFEALESGRQNEALTISLLLLAVSAAILILLRSHWLSPFSGSRRPVRQQPLAGEAVQADIGEAAQHQTKG